MVHLLHWNGDAESYYHFKYQNNMAGTLIANIGYCHLLGNFAYPGYISSKSDVPLYWGMHASVEVKWGTGYSYGSLRAIHTDSDINQGFQVMLAQNGSGSAPPELWIHLYFDGSQCTINHSWWDS